MTSLYSYQDDLTWSILNEDTQDQDLPSSNQDRIKDDLTSRHGSPVLRSFEADQDLYDDEDSMIMSEDEEDDLESRSPLSPELNNLVTPALQLSPPGHLPSQAETHRPSHRSSQVNAFDFSHHSGRPFVESSSTAMAAEDDDEDDAKIMARLMAQHHERQHAGSQVAQAQVSQEAHCARAREDQASSEKARLFLEHLCLDFLNQLYVSEQTIAARARAKRAKAKGKTGGKRKRESDTEGEDEEHAGGRVGVTISLKNRKTGGDHVVNFPDDPALLSDQQPGTSMIRIARILCVASLMYEACLSGVTTTKRDIYYKDVRLFGNQAVVDNLVDDIVATAGLRRKHFNVCAASKGLMISSCLEIWLKSGDKLACSASTAALIPPIETIERIDATTPPEWVLIVEKDAVFQPLCGMKLLEEDRLGPGVIVTGKGYPDLATLQLLALIADHYPSTKFYGLFDADPHGLDILSVYTYGSQSSRFSHDHSDLPLRDRLEWMGVKASEFLRIGVRHDDLLPLTEKDVQKANAMLRDPLLRPDCRHCTLLSPGHLWAELIQFRRELVHMLHLDRKAEIQVILGASPEGKEGFDNGGPGMLLEYIATRMMI